MTGVTAWTMLRGLVLLRRIARALEAIAEKSRAEEPARSRTPVEISRPTVGQWNERWRRGREERTTR
jgi:hypothetical protein